jgi:hypothetical protein
VHVTPPAPPIMRPPYCDSAWRLYYLFHPIAHRLALNSSRIQSSISNFPSSTSRRIQSAISSGLDIFRVYTAISTSLSYQLMLSFITSVGLLTCSREKSLLTILREIAGTGSIRWMDIHIQTNTRNSLWIIQRQTKASSIYGDITDPNITVTC